MANLDEILVRWKVIPLEWFELVTFVALALLCSFCELTKGRMFKHLDYLFPLSTLAKNELNI
jgi:hypothetical protein